MSHQFVARAALASAIALGAFSPRPASATQVDAVAVPAEVAPTADSASDTVSDTAACCVVPARTVVEIEIVDHVNSRTNQSREMFAIRLAAPLVVDGRVVAPAGTPGLGEIVHAARARAGGKAGELILAARYLEVEGVRLPLRSFRYGPSQGLDNSGAVNAGGMVAAALLPAAAVLGFLISGGEVDIPAGTRAHAMIASEAVLAPAE